jgi:4-amino-4-deoxy-L-arabinose transferase-like glycosyltransferase
MAGSRQLTYHSGGSDAPAYDLLARGLLAHNGLSYAGQPTAFRPPGYPLLIAGIIAVSNAHYLEVIRLLQIILGLVTVGICSAAALSLFSLEAAEAGLILGLFLPTLIFPTAQLLTECLSAFLSSLFFYCLVKQFQEAGIGSAIGLGLTSGLGSLIRFNAAALPLVAGWAVFRTRNRNSTWLRCTLALLLPMLIVLPWLIRNEVVFHGHVLFSTQSGPNAVQGVLTPEGRTQVGDTDRLINTMGWSLSQLETNNSSRLSLGSEAELNQRAWHTVPRLWKQEGLNAIPLLGKKVGNFWLSLDQLRDTGSFSSQDRLIRAAGVLAYWIVLAFAVEGWLRLRRARPGLAYMLLTYAIGITVLHLPLVMNTRVRIPLLDPLVVILSGAGLVRFLDWIRNNGSSLALSCLVARPSKTRFPAEEA